MIVDASALLAIVLGEPDRQRFYVSLGRSNKTEISAVNYVEAGVRSDRDRSHERRTLLDEILDRFAVRIAAVTPTQAVLAHEAYRRYGKGNHPARLNLGDCFAYALAKTRNEPLLFKGDDFTKTDIEPAL